MEASPAYQEKQKAFAELELDPGDQDLRNLAVLFTRWPFDKVAAFAKERYNLRHTALVQVLNSRKFFNFLQMELTATRLIPAMPRIVDGLIENGAKGSKGAIDGLLDILGRTQDRVLQTQKKVEQGQVTLEVSLRELGRQITESITGRAPRVLDDGAHSVVLGRGARKPP